MENKIELKKNILIAVLSVMLTVSVIVNVYLGYGKKLNTPHNIVGTYLSGSQLEDGKYLVFMQDNTYVWYKQFEVLAQGSYVKSQENVFNLYGVEKAMPLQVVYGQDRVYLVEDGKMVVSYEKIDDIPTLINIDID